jgi:hypothetical protein
VDTDVSDEESASVFGAEMSHFSPSKWRQPVPATRLHTLENHNLNSVLKEKSKKKDKLEREGYDGCLHRVILHKGM